MDITVVKGGKFVLQIDKKTFSKGLRPSENVPRNNDFAIQLVGAVGREGALKALETIYKLNTAIIDEDFPYPQFFVLSEMMLVCSSTKIYEVVNNLLVEKYTAPMSGIPWTLTDFHDFIYMTNGRWAVKRDAGSGVWGTANQPTAACMCNFNGQVILGSPEIEPWKVWPAKVKGQFAMELTLNGSWGENMNLIDYVVWPVVPERTRRDSMISPYSAPSTFPSPARSMWR